MSDRGFLGGLFDGDAILWLIILFLLLFWGWGGYGYGARHCCKRIGVFLKLLCEIGGTYKVKQGGGSCLPLFLLKNSAIYYFRPAYVLGNLVIKRKILGILIKRKVNPATC